MSFARALALEILNVEKDTLDCEPLEQLLEWYIWRVAGSRLESLPESYGETERGNKLCAAGGRRLLHCSGKRAEFD